MELQVGVKAFLRNKEGRYLLARRNPLKYPEVGAKWDIIGGRINPGSPLFENLKREVKEETGLDLADEPRLVAAQDILRVQGRHVVRLTYVGVIEGDPQIDEESLEYKWFTMDELRACAGDELDMFFKALLDQGTLYVA